MNGVVQNDAWREEYDTLKVQTVIINDLWLHTLLTLYLSLYQEQYTELKRLKEEVKKLEKSCLASSQKQLKKLSTTKKQLYVVSTVCSDRMLF